MKSIFPSIFHRDDARTALQSRLDNVFDEFARDWMSNWPGVRAERQNLFPAIDVKECGEYFEIKAELPDMDEKDIEVEVQGNYLSIKGEKKFEQDKDEKGYHFRERSFGLFNRQIPLGFNADVDAITAKYDRGVLSIHVPKPEELQHGAKKVRISFKE
ncbi:MULTISPECIES: Hsp20/alpha crystallin family protein [Shewanella]|uniref:Hsp20/alpha crystallin family protein n=1 Tax=Shewanella salipaludis TaxID=2723052 RepID=A0A972G2E3_9GAMM|nr:MULTISPECIES: Hsp20/alpha crystallin family protein [Shewanella]MCE9688121.1 Hsp20/alpha crystallin family protein [Shewanella sp. AS16]NMH66241.1 Hsp20/alpha crystallin family protein [Shewanella salipaludis]